MCTPPYNVTENRKATYNTTSGKSNFQSVLILVEIFKTNTDKSSIRQTCKAQPLPRMHTNTEDRWAVENSPINIENICMFLSNYSYKEEASFFY